MTETLTKEEAIRQVILDGAGGDYVDVANRVKERFHLDVGVALVEQVAIKFREGKAATESGTNGGTTKVKDSGALPKDDSSSNLGLTLKFVEAIGGFQAARDAIDNLERSLKKLS